MRRQAPQNRWTAGCRSVALTALLAAAAPRIAAAQSVERPTEVSPRLLVGLEGSAILGPRDDIAFFNYTDYEHNALRLVRARLFGEWRVAPWVSFVGEIRTEGQDGVDAAAAFARFRPWSERAITVQVGRIPPVVGAFNRRAYGRDNPLIGLPLAYQYLTSLRPDALPATVDDLLRMRARGWRPAFPVGAATLGPGIPLVSVSQWSSGASIRWQGARVDAAGAWSLGAPGVPALTDQSAGQWSGRLGVMLPAGVTIGGSVARGQWIDRSVLALVPEDRRDAAHQTLLATDMEFGRGPWLVRAEWLRSSFDMPYAMESVAPGDLVASSGFVETRVRVHPRWHVALRLDRMTFGTVRTPAGSVTPWESAVDRVEGAIGFRVVRRVDVRAGWQQNWRDGGRVRERGFPALQVMFWY